MGDIEKKHKTLKPNSFSPLKNNWSAAPPPLILNFCSPGSLDFALPEPESQGPPTIGAPYLTHTVHHLHLFLPQPYLPKITAAGQDFFFFHFFPTLQPPSRFEALLPSQPAPQSSTPRAAPIFPNSSPSPLDFFWFTLPTTSPLPREKSEQPSPGLDFFLHSRCSPETSSFNHSSVVPGSARRPSSPTPAETPTDLALLSLNTVSHLSHLHSSSLDTRRPPEAEEKKNPTDPFADPKRRRRTENRSGKEQEKIKSVVVAFS